MTYSTSKPQGARLEPPGLSSSPAPADSRTPGGGRSHARHARRLAVRSSFYGESIKKGGRRAETIATARKRLSVDGDISLLSSPPPSKPLIHPSTRHGPAWSEMWE